MRNPFRRRKSTTAGSSRPAGEDARENTEPYAVEALEPRVLLAADLGAGLDVSSAWENESQQHTLFAEAFDEASSGSRLAELSRELSPLAGAIRQGIADTKAAPLDLTQLGGLLEGASTSLADSIASDIDPAESSIRDLAELRYEVVFVDTDTPDYQRLVDDLLEQGDPDRHFEVVLLDNDRDGIAQITETLAQYQDLSAVHIISHGSDGSMDLGGTRLEFDTLLSNAALIKQWGDAFTADGDLLIYGCNLAASQEGQALVGSLARLTGADVAASDDLTGNAQLGGDWELEYQTGQVESDVSISGDAQQDWSGLLADPNAGTAIWRESGSSTPETSEWDGTAFGAEGLATSTGSWRIMQGAESSERDEKIVIGVDDSGNINGMLWDGSSWSQISLDGSNTFGTVSQNYWWGMDVQYESQSGDALMVWTDGSNIEYATWDGTSWSSVGTISSYGGATPRQLQLATSPDSDEMALVVSDSNSRDSVFVWDGTSWGSEQVLATNSGDNRTDIYVTYEQQSDDAMVVYGKATADAYYRTWDGTSWSSEGTISQAGGTSGNVSWTTLASDANSDRIALGVLTSGGDVWLNVWDGSTWDTSTAATTTSTGTTELAVAVAFESTSGDAIATYGESGSNNIKYRTWSAGGGWSTEQIGPNIGAVPNSMTLSSDPLSDRVMLAVNDDASDVNYVLWDGNAWGTVTEQEINSGETKNQPFLFLWDQVPGNQAPDITSDGGAATASVNVTENTTVVTTVTATDADLDTVSYSISGGADAALFNINSSTGELTFIAAPDYETPADANADNVYEVTVQADDGKGAVDTQAISVTVTPVNEAPLNTVPGTQTIDEDTTLVFSSGNGNAISVSDPEAPASTEVTVTALDATATESGQTTATFRISRSDTSGDLAVYYNIGGTAGPGDIVESLSGMVTITDGNSFVDVTITPTDDTVDDDAETVVLTLAGDSRYRIGATGAATATITDDDPAPGSTISSTDFEGGLFGDWINAAGDNDDWDVRQGSTPSSSTGPNHDNTTGGAGGYYVHVEASDPRLFTAGEEAHLVGPTIDAGAYTGMTLEFFYHMYGADIGTLAVDVDSGSGFTQVWGLSGQQHTASADPFTQATVDLSAYSGTIDIRFRVVAAGGYMGDIALDDISITGTAIESTVTVAAIDAGGAEQGSDPGTFRITRDGTSGDLTVKYNISGSALSGDYSEALSGAVVIPDGSSFVDVTVTPADDTLLEGSQTVILTLVDGGTEYSLGAGSSATVNITDNDKPEVTLTATNGTVTLSGTTGLTFSSGDGTDDASMTFQGEYDDINAALEGLVFTPTANFNGTATLQITTDDRGNSGAGGALSDTDVISITVNDTNTAPVLGAIGDQSIDEGATLSFTATATDSDLPADTLTFSLDAASMALGMSIDANSGAFSWTPTEGQGGLTPSVTVTVTDDGTGNLVDSETFTITVNDTNTAPVLGAIGNQTVDELATVSFTATATDADLPADTLTFSLDAASLALGMTIDANTGAFSWTPTEGQGGLTPSVTVTVMDDGTGNLIDSETFTITVNDTNTAPVLGAIGDQSIDELATLSFTATATDSDLPADTLTFSLDAASIALGMSIGANTGAFSWTPTEGQGGSAPSVTVTVTDDGTGNLVDSETFTITVNDLNTAPVLGAIGNQTVDEGSTLTFTATATDSDLPADTLSFSLDAASIALGMTIDANTGAFSWTPTESQGGLTPSVTVTVTDDGTGNLVDSETLTITVNELNTAPVLGAVGDQSVDEGATLSFTATATDSDLPADTLTFSLDAASIALGMSIDASTGAFSWTPTESQGGLTPAVTVTVTDNGTGNLIDSETFTITVNDLNTAPVLGAIGDQSVDELATLTFTATATDSDLPADNLTFTLDAASIALGMSIDANTGAFSWTPTESQGGLTPSVTVTVTDNGTGNLVDSETITITVNDTYTAPVLGAIGNQTVDELATLSFTATATDSDLPADNLTFTLDAASIALGMSIDANTGAFSWTPSEAQGGLTPSVTLTVTDDGTGNLVDSETFTITVNDTNTAPVLGAIGDQSVDELATLSFTATATDSDLPADNLTFSLDAASLALGMTIDANTGAFSWTPTEAQGGTTPSVTVTVTDDGTGSLVDSETFTITVNDLNTAPVLGAIGNQTVDEGATLIFSATATDSDLPTDNLTFTLDAASIALGMSIDANTGVFSWTPTEGQGGTTPSVTVTVTDDGTGNLVDSETFTITVNDVNVAPVLGAIGGQTVDEGATLSFTATATDSDLPADTLTFSLDAASIALGMTIDANTGAFSWTPTEGQGGLTPSVTVTVSDDGAGTLIDSETFTITVNDLNTAPVLGAIGNQTVDEGATLSFTATATDADLPADTLTFSLDAASIALGMSIDANTGAFSWTPTESQGGLTPSVTVTVTDDGTGNLIDSETFTITVNDLNTAPVLGGIGNQSIDEGATLSFTAPATDSDLPADNLTFTLDAASIALGMSIDANTGDFSWTPSEAQGGTTPSVTVTVTDDGTGNLVDSETFTITVNDVNVAPVLGAIGDQTVDEGATLSFTATATDSDLPADTLTFSLDAASIALGMTIDANTGAFSWTPSEAQGGITPSVTITVTDDGTGSLIDSETFTITVNDLNTAPVLGAIGDQSVDELATLSFTATATDSDLPADTLSFSLDAASLALGMTIDANTGAFSWTPSEGQGGLTPSVTVTVTDDGTGNLIDSETFTITVNDVNVAPVLGAIGDQSIDELATLSFTVTATDADLPADTLTFSLDAASIALGMTIDANTGAFSWTPTEAQGGTTPSVTVTVTDDGTGSLIDSETFTITVNDLNTAPVLGAIGDQSIDELATLSFTATATDSDLPADNLTFTLDAASIALGMSIDANTGAFSWTPTEGQGGTTPSVTVTVTDDGTGNLVDSETFTITVNDVNVAPVLGAIGDQTVDEGATLSFTATATDSDLPADTLTFSLDAASIALGMSIDANTGAFSWTPTEGQGGLTPSVTVTVSDDGAGTLIDSETFTITVNDLNTAPVLGAIGNQTVDEGATLSFAATATDADLPADTLTFSLDAASIALGMSIDANTGAFSWTPTEAQGGLTPSVTVTVTDDGTGNLVDSETFTITVNDVNLAPVLGAIGDQSIDELVTLSFTATATDSDLPADNLTFSLDAASIALGMSIDANTGAFSWTPTEAQGGTTPSVTVTVTDDGTGNLFDSETFTITVNDLNTAPVLGAIGNQTVNELATLTFTATATDSDLPADTLTFSLDAVSIALGMSIDANTGAFSWTPTEAQGGTTPSVTVTVIDDGTGNLIDSETFTITVNDTNTAPVLGAIGNQTVDEGAILSFTATATDSDLPADNLTFTLDAASTALGMSIDANTGTFSWTPTEAQGGTTPSVTITVTDDGTGNLIDSETFTITVNDLNVAPVLGAIGDQTVDEGATLSFAATATDADLPADTLTFSLDAASIALGMSIDANTGAFSWTPTEAQGGTTPSVTVTVTDDGTGNLVDSETFTITVNDLNTAPVLGAIGNQTVDELATLTFTATASDSDLPADNLTFTLDAASIALGMSVDANTGAFSWMPTEAQGGTTPSVTVTVTDDGTGNLIDSETFTITVNDTNTAPVLGAVGNQTVDEGATLSFTATATDSDLPADNLTFTLDAASIALGMSIDANTGAFSWTPTESQGGLTPSVTVTVTDDGTGNLIDSETFTITVNDLNTAPVLGAIGNQTVDEGATLSFTATATDADLPADTLTFSLDAASIVLGMSIDANTGAFSWTPSEAQGGITPSVTITVSDDGTGSLIDSETFTITVNDTNTAPVLGAIGDQSVDELATLSFTATATDSDLPADNLTFTLDAASIALGMSIDANTGAFSWTPTESQGGLTPSVTVTVTDNGTGNLIDSETFTITVNDLNTAPVLGAIGNQTVDELATLSFTATATDSDLPADTLTFSLDAASLALGMTIDANTGAFSWTPAEGQGGTTPSVTVTVTDDGTGSLIDSETFTITVNDTNTAPVLGAIGNQSVDELAILTFTATATDADLPADTLTFSLDAASIVLGMSIDANTGAFSWTPTEAQGGLTPSVTVTVTDDGTGNLIDSETFTITVNDLNTAPVLGAIGNQTVDELATLSFTATATDADLPADTLTFSLDAASIALGMSIDANTGAFSWTPTESQGGLTPSVTVTVTDDGTGTLIDSETFTITVNDTNTAPVLGAIGNQTVDEGATLSFTATATDADLPADTLIFSLDAASIALGMSIDANTGAFSWTPTEGQGGTTPSVTVTVTDDGTGNLIDSETFTITVNDTNTAPVLGAIGDQTVDELAILTFTATATDADLPADGLIFSLDAASIALGMSIDANTGAFSWTPTEAQGGTNPSVTVTVTDDGTGNLIDSETFSITVNDTNTAPVVGAIGNQTVDEGATLTFTATATDSDLPADNLTFTLDAASIALGMSIDPNTGAFSWTPTEGQGGTTPSVTVTVTDDGTGNLVDSETFSITVNDLNTAPVLGAIGNQTVDEGSTLSFTATATDADLPADTLTFSLDAASIALGMNIDANTGAFSWTPTEGQGGTTPSVTVTVTDDGTGSLIDSETFTITVNDTNTAPVLGAIGNQTVDEGATLTFTATATDSDLPADTLTYSLDAASIALGMNIDANTGAFSWTPTEGQGGLTPSVTVTVTDDGTGSLVDSETFTITVNDTNTAPVLGAIGNQTVDEGATLSFTATATDSDLPADNLTFTLDAASIALGMSIDANAGDFSWTPSEAQGGTTPSVTVTVTDDGTGSLIDSETFTITANELNAAPVIISDGGGATAAVSVAENQTAVTTVISTDVDLPADILTYSLSGGADQALFSIDSNSGVLSFVSARDYEAATDANLDGVYEVEVQVSDGTATDTQLISVTVTDANDAPTLANIAKSGNEDAPMLFSATDFTAAFSDLDGGSMTQIEVISLPANGTLEVSGVAVGLNDVIAVSQLGNLSFTPDAQWNGTTSFDWKGYDGGAWSAAGATVNITVNAVNDAPSGSDNTVSTLQDNGHTFTATEFGFSDAADADALLAVRITTAPGAGTLLLNGVALVGGETVSAADIAAGNLVFVPPADANGAGYATFTFQVQDDGGVAHGGVDLDPTVNAMIVDVTADSSVPVPELFDEVDPVEPLPVTSVVGVPGGVQDRDEDGVVQERPSDLIEDSTEEPAAAEPAVEEPVADTAGLQPDPVAVDQLADSGETSTGTVAMHVQLKAVLNNAIAQQASLTGTLGLPNRAPTQAPGDPARLLAESPDFRNALDNLKDHVTDQTAIYEAAVRSGTVLATGLSIGYVAWLAKGGLMAASLVTSLPLWRIFDPIPVLGYMDDSREGEDGEGESLASMFESQEEIEQPAVNKDVGNEVLPSDAEDVTS